MNNHKLGNAGKILLFFLAVIWFVEQVESAEERLILKSGGYVQGCCINTLDKYRKVCRFLNRDGIQIEISEDCIEKIEYVGMDEEAFQNECAKYEDSVIGNISIARWCEKNKYSAHAKAFYLRVLELDSENEEARSALGYVKQIDGQWRTPEEEKAAQGQVLYKGKWRSKQEVEYLENQSSNKIEIAKMTRSISKWVKELKTSKSGEARDQLDALRDPLAVPGLLECLSKERDSGVREVLIRALGRIGTPEAVELLMRGAVDEEVEELRMICLDLLQEHKGKGVTEYFILRLSPKKSLNPQINRAAYALGVLGDSTAVEPLVEALYTTHKSKVVSGSNPGQTSAGMGRSGSGGSVGGLSMGSTTTILSKKVQNPEVLEALKKLTNQNFMFNQAGWRAWYQQQVRVPDATIRE